MPHPVTVDGHWPGTEAHTVTARWPSTVANAPVSIFGVAEAGNLLTCVAPGATSFQWLRDGVAINGATSSQYLVVGGDLNHQISCRAARESQSITISTAGPSTLNNTAAPGVVSADVTVGTFLTGDRGAWLGGDPITYTYRWMRCDATGLNGVAIAGATTQTYQVDAADIGHTLRLEVTASDPDEITTVLSPRTGKVSTLMRGAFIVASRGNAFGQSVALLSDGTELSRTYGRRHSILFDATQIYVLYGNYGWGINDGGHTPNTLTALKAALRRGSTVYPVLFSGSRGVSLAAGQFVRSDLIDIGVAQGDFLFSYSCPVVGTLGHKWCLDLHAGNIAGEGMSAGDVVDSGNVALANGSAGFSPVAILAATPATPPQPVIASIGTSICHGVGDANQDEGFITRGLENAGFGVLRHGYRSQALYQLVANVSILTPTWAACTHALLGDMVNDVAAGRSVVQMQSTLTTILNLMQTLGTKVVVHTTTPDPNFSAPLEANRVAINAYIRGLVAGGANPHTAVVGLFDAADATETSRDSGVWKTGYSSDNVHPNVTGHTALAGAIDPALFTAT